MATADCPACSSTDKEILELMQKLMDKIDIQNGRKRASNRRKSSALEGNTELDQNIAILCKPDSQKMQNTAEMLETKLHEFISLKVTEDKIDNEVVQYREKIKRTSGLRVIAQEETRKTDSGFVSERGSVIDGIQETRQSQNNEKYILLKDDVVKDSKV